MLYVFTPSSIESKRVHHLIEQSKPIDYYNNLREGQDYFQARSLLLNCTKQYHAVLEIKKQKESLSTSSQHSVVLQQLKPLIKWIIKRPRLWELCSSLYFMAQRLKNRKKYETATKS